MIFGNSDIEFSIIRDIENARIKAYENECKAFAFTTEYNNGPIEVTRSSGIHYYIYYIHKNKVEINLYRNYLNLFHGQMVIENGEKFIIFPTQLEYASMVR